MTEAELGFLGQRMDSVKAENSCRNTNRDLEAVTNILATCFPVPNNFLFFLSVIVDLLLKVGSCCYCSAHSSRAEFGRVPVDCLLGDVAWIRSRWGVPCQSEVHWQILESLSARKWRRALLNVLTLLYVSSKFKSGSYSSGD